MNGLEAHASARTRQQAITEAENAVENAGREIQKLLRLKAVNREVAIDTSIKVAVVALASLARLTGDPRSVAECDAFLSGVAS